MKKLFLLISFLLVTPATHTAAALEIPEKQRYVDIPRALEIQNNANERFKKGPFQNRFGASIMREARMHNTRYIAAGLAANALKSTTMTNAEKVCALIDNNFSVNNEYWIDCKKIIVHMIEKETCDINSINSDNLLLAISIKQRDLEFTRYLLEHNADVNKQEAHIAQKTALNYVVDCLESKHPACVLNLNANVQFLRLLISFDANPDLFTFKEKSARNNASKETLGSIYI